MLPVCLLDGDWSLGFALALAYLLGSIPFGFVLAKALRGVDLREVGSGNIGATNAMRVLGRPLGLVAFALDVGKGFAPVWMLGAGDPRRMVLVGAAAVCGHVWPIFLRFRGGKAVATGVGAIVAIDPLVAFAAGAVWLVVLFLSSYVALASMAMAVAWPLVAWLRMGERPHGWWFVAATAVLCLLILWRHRSNISRILAGEESRSRIGLRREQKEAHDV